MGGLLLGGKVTFSYNLPSAGAFPSDKDEVRFLVRDTEETDQSIQDEEILYLLEDSEDRVYLAASKAAFALANNYRKAAQVASRSVGDLSISNSFKDVANEYTMLARQLRYGRQTTKTAVYFDNTGEYEDGNQFAIGQYDNRQGY